MTEDQFTAQVRLLLPVLGILLTLCGVKESTSNVILNIVMTCAGPGFMLAGSLWSLAANTRKSIMLSAAKPVNGGPPPQIVLPKEEAELAKVLPANVTTAAESIVVPKKPD